MPDSHSNGPAGVGELARYFPRIPLSARTVFGGRGTIYGDFDDLAAGIEGRTWATLDEPFLTRHHTVLHFVDDAVLVQLLPAWLAAVLDRDDPTGHIQRSAVNRLTPDELAAGGGASGDAAGAGRGFDAWTQEQRRTVARILARLEARYRREHARPDWRWVDAVDNPVTPALDRYWRRALAGGPPE